MPLAGLLSAGALGAVGVHVALIVNVHDVTPKLLMPLLVSTVHV